MVYTKGGKNNRQWTGVDKTKVLSDLKHVTDTLKARYVHSISNILT